MLLTRWRKGEYEVGGEEELSVRQSCLSQEIQAESPPSATRGSAPSSPLLKDGAEELDCPQWAPWPLRGENHCE